MVAKTKIVAISHQDLVLIFNSEKSPCGFTFPIIQKKDRRKDQQAKNKPNNQGYFPLFYKYIHN